MWFLSIFLPPHPATFLKCKNSCQLSGYEAWENDARNVTNVGQQGLYQVRFGEVLRDEMSRWTWDTREGRSKVPSQERITAKASDGAISGVGGTGINHKIQLETTSGKCGENYIRNGSSFLHPGMKFKVQSMFWCLRDSFWKDEMCRFFCFANISSWTGNCRGDSNARAVFSRGNELFSLLEWGRKRCLSSSEALRELGDYKPE